MRSLLLSALLLSASFAASAADTYRFDGGVVSVGDSVAALSKRAERSPDRTEPVENAFGARTGERWEYHFGNKQVTFTIVEGRVSRITETR